MKGKLIVIDGTDGTGKATQTGLLVKKLKEEGYKVKTADFPQYGQRSATLVEDYLNGTFGDAKSVGPYKASIFFACDQYAASFKIKKWLEEGKIVVSNRYISSNMGHQGGKIKEKIEKDFFLKWLDNLAYNIFELPKPDKTILLYLSAEIGQSLVDKKGHRKYTNRKRDIHEEDLQHLKDAAETYLYVANKYKWDILDCAPNGKLRTIEDISEELWRNIQPLIKCQQ